MSDPLRLDPETQDALRRFIADEKLSRGYQLDDKTLHVPDTSSLFSKLKPYIDTDRGGLKLYETTMNGTTTTLSIIPRIERSAGGRFGGSVSFGLTIKF